MHELTQCSLKAAQLCSCNRIVVLKPNRSALITSCTDWIFALALQVALGHCWQAEMLSWQAQLCSSTERAIAYAQKGPLKALTFMNIAPSNNALLAAQIPHDT
jgi:hypothetical protein